MRKTSERLRCCICGGGTEDSPRYIEIEVTVADGDDRQLFGAHADHFESVLAQGFRLEILD
ncbi:hypothetical protein Lfu02_02540 [Longispora fulva]|uniref:Uncharacterized protein n=1 Tax=Longispora fulva TaxID=619741 RepID=A0A8J7KI68_9ACTN|nr:hypothetical protein [Longispora fulva]MBG6135874.1 hypothetical protein [Longispora fulva]GIG55882.1 hypothetical protein Lfu02_02540 [Longispora fulva]